jgi:tetratricopeptide (TPR) repeat protein
MIIGDYTNSIFHFKQVNELNPKDAISYYSKKANSKDVFSYFNLGVIQKLQGNNDEASVNLKKAYQFAPNAEVKDKFYQIIKLIK